MKKRVLILSASSGAGHVQAGKALEKAFSARAECEVQHFDALDYTSKLFQKIYDDAYLALVRRAPHVFGWIYRRTDRPWQNPRRRLALERLNTRPMIQLLRELQPDICVATHFLPAEIISWLKTKRKIRARHAIVVTDFDVHAMWLCRPVDRYFVAVEETAEYLKQLGIEPDSVSVTGIPIDPRFAEPKDARALRMQLGLDPSALTLLLVGGGHAIGPMEHLVTDLLTLDRPWQIVAVAGHAAETRARLEKLAARLAKTSPGPARLRVLGFTEEMDNWMGAADLLIGKAGGMTVSEALASGLPIAIVGELAGPQEERNAEYLLERGAAIRCHNLLTAAWKIARLLDDSAGLRTMRTSARSLGQPLAASKIAEESLRMLLEAPASMPRRTKVH